jgi:hypothetical protein
MGTHTRLMSIRFRGEDQDIDFWHEGGVICWHFYGMPLAEQEALAVTDDEDTAIIQQIDNMLFDEASNDDWDRL